VLIKIIILKSIGAIENINKKTANRKNIFLLDNSKIFKALMRIIMPYKIKVSMNDKNKYFKNIGVSAFMILGFNVNKGFSIINR